MTIRDLSDTFAVRIVFISVMVSQTHIYTTLFRHH